MKSLDKMMEVNEARDYECEENHERKETLFSMLRLTPAKPVDDAAEISSIITPPSKDSVSMSFNFMTPSLASLEEESRELDGSFTQLTTTTRKPLGRFLSFDVKRSLFCGKRLAEDQMLDAMSPVTKKLREAESAIKSFSLESPEATPTRSNIISFVNRLATEEDLVADGSRQHCLPTVKGKHRDLKSISPKTVSDALSGVYDDVVEHVTIIDCRYPYEFDGGHIKGAINLYTRDAVQNFLLQHKMTSSTKKHVLIFHCEFSSERGPKLFRFLRSQDREMNKDNYPLLTFPEIYLLEGGYKAFYYSHLEYCEPQAYIPMLHKDHTDDLRHFRVKSKSWSAGEKSNSGLSRLSLRF